MNRDNEIWVDAYGYDGCYEVSNTGKVRSLDRWVENAYNGGYMKKGRELKLCFNQRKVSVGLSIDGIKYGWLVSRLVFISFNNGELPSERTICVSHKDRNPKNNHIDNLRLESVSDNHADNYKFGLLNHMQKSDFRTKHKDRKKEGKIQCLTCDEWKPKGEYREGRLSCTKCRAVAKHEHYLKRRQGPSKGVYTELV